MPLLSSPETLADCPGTVEGLAAGVSAALAPAGLEAAPFVTSWYNDQRRKVSPQNPQLIDTAVPCLGFIVYSNPSMFDRMVEWYAQQRRPINSPVEEYVDAVLDELVRALPGSLEPVATNTDKPCVWPECGPGQYIHVQTLGAIAGVDEHVEPEGLFDDDELLELREQLREMRDVRLYGEENVERVLGVNIHPRYGGYYGYRGCVLLRAMHGEQIAEMRPAPPLAFLSLADKKRIIEEFNLRFQQSGWRELGASTPSALVHDPVRDKYSGLQFLYFGETDPGKRRHALALEASRIGH